jgi:hypothetical protein
MKERDIEMKDNEKRKIENDCANAPVSTTNKLGERGKTMEDQWINEHEAALMEAARARRESPASPKECGDRCSKQCDDHDHKRKCCK